jgi:hypothetical protein
VTATNSNSFTSTPVAPIGFTGTAVLGPSIKTYPTTLTFSSPNYYTNNPRSISAGETVSSIFQKNATITTNSVTFPINTVPTRGIQGGSGNVLLDLSCNVTQNSTVVRQGPNLKFYGFGSTLQQTSSTLNNETISTSITDSYNTTSGSDGFYLQSANTLQITSLGSAGIVASPNPYSFNLYYLSYTGSTGTSGYTGVTGVTGTVQTPSFYYDGVIGAPTISNNIVNVTDASNVQVSGINFIYGNVKYIIDTSANNMGDYFYSQPLLTYQFVSGTYTSSNFPTTGLTQITSGYDSTNKLFTTGTLGIRATQTDSAVQNQSTLFYTGTITNRVTANNILSSSTISSYNTANQYIIDISSNNFIKNTALYPSTINGIGYSTPSGGTTTAKPGYRVWSQTVDPSYVYVPAITSTIVATIPYNQSWNLTSTGSGNAGGYDATGELQIFKGTIGSKGATTFGYLNYSSYYYGGASPNTFNYSGISTTVPGFRYVTFVYRCNEYSSTYNNLTFYMNGINQSVVFDTTTNIPYVNSISTSNQILLFYRIQDASNVTVFDNNHINTVWVDANLGGDGPTKITSSNYYSYPDDGSGIRWGKKGTSNTFSSGTLSFSVSIPPFTVPFDSGGFTSGTIYIYCRVGLPMTTYIGFTNVSALLQQTV